MVFILYIITCNSKLGGQTYSSSSFICEVFHIPSKNYELHWSANCAAFRNFKRNRAKIKSCEHGASGVKKNQFGDLPERGKQAGPPLRIDGTWEEGTGA